MPTKTATFYNMAEWDWRSGHPISNEGGAVTGKTEGEREHNRKKVPWPHTRHVTNSLEIHTRIIGHLKQVDSRLTTVAPSAQVGHGMHMVFIS